MLLWMPVNSRIPSSPLRMATCQSMTPSESMRSRCARERERLWRQADRLDTMAIAMLRLTRKEVLLFWVRSQSSVFLVQACTMAQRPSALRDMVYLSDISYVKVVVQEYYYPRAMPNIY